MNTSVSAQTATGGQANYRDILRCELKDRSAKNTQYSMRAFAKTLGLDVAHLSRILRGQKQLSMENGYVVAQRLFKSAREREYFLHLLALESNPGKMRTLKAPPAQNRWNLLSLEQFELVANWYHFAILDFSTLPGVTLTPSKAATYLGISVREAREAIERLERLGLLAKRGGKLIKTHAKLTTTNNVPSAALRSLHKQMLAKASAAIEAQTVDRRYFISRTLTLRRAQLKELCQLIDDFYDRVSASVSAPEVHDAHDALYQLNVQLFDLKEGK